MKLSGKVALITGGSRGIGKAIAKEFAQSGATIVISGINKTKLGETAKELGAFAIPADMRKEDQVQNLINKAVEKFGKLDILVNNAGIFPKIKLLHEISSSEWRDVLDVNLNGPFYATKYSIPICKKMEEP